MVDEDSGPGTQRDERRQHPRASAEWTVTLALQDDSGAPPVPVEARVRDISRAGVCFYLERSLPMMALLEVRLELPVEHGVRNISGRGAVVRCERISAAVDHYEIAVFLHDMAEPDRTAIDSYVTSQDASAN